MSDTEPRFKKGDLVRKTQGAKFWGEIKSEPYITLLESQWHYDVMAIHPDFKGTVHILIESQLEAIRLELMTPSYIYAL